jgi:peptide subunit release factor 1 (eRF1)
MEAYINKPKDLSESEINDAVEKAYNSLGPNEQIAVDMLINEMWRKLIAKSGAPLMGERSIRQALALLVIYQTHQGRSWAELL